MCLTNNILLLETLNTSKGSRNLYTVPAKQVPESAVGTDVINETATDAIFSGYHFHLH